MKARRQLCSVFALAIKWSRTGDNKGRLARKRGIVRFQEMIDFLREISTDEFKRYLKKVYFLG